ncbi:DNA primase small subunit [Tubulinosema ratisbonensis]|uniref:DNA primase small subunit n=1 Tax=Tubulinosema ratisbonensis TaxID=291195 RepID=A0A437AMZ9_9MICR|nr:DNA primase small subunit [Tubulinosema ratisbonensis]
MDENETTKLKKYYENSYPFAQMFDLFRVNDRREFSLTLANEAYLRYNTFNTVQEFKSIVCEKVPTKFDIGAIYKERPQKGLNNIPEKKELVFDIDLTDYPRDCCTGKSICSICFTIIKVSVKLLNYILSQEFGFKKIKFFFSGNRGLHCWVFDEDALLLDGLERKSLTGYINYVNQKGLFVEEYINILKEYFDLKDHKELIEKYYLKLDAKVSHDLNHLLKAPFCIHPLSKKVCIPVHARNIDDLYLDDIPTLSDVINEPSILDEYVKELLF